MPIPEEQAAATALAEQHKATDKTDVTTDTTNSDDVDTDVTNDDAQDDSTGQDTDDGWEEFAAAKGIKGKSFDEAMDALSQWESGTHPSLQQKAERKIPDKSTDELSRDELLIPDAPFQKHIIAMERSGEMTPAVSAEWKTVATLVDTAYAPVFKKLNQFMQEVSFEWYRMQESQRGSEWNSLPDEYRSIANRQEIDQLMQNQRFPDYRTAIQYYTSTKKPDALVKLLSKARADGVKEGEKKKFTFSKSMQRGNGNPQPQVKLADYMNERGTYDLDRLGKALGGRDKALELVKKEAAKGVNSR